jgi:hypothetical protein
VFCAKKPATGVFAKNDDGVKGSVARPVGSPVVAVATRTCSRCGTMAEGPEDGLPEGWAFEVEDGRMVWTCGPCVRRNIRAVEAKLAQEWWD